VERAIVSGQTIYGINTGFGKLANVRIAPDSLDALQVNLIRSHAAGIGAPLPAGVVRAVMLLRANVLLRPTSGVRPELVEALVALLNAGVVRWCRSRAASGRAATWHAQPHRPRAHGEGSVLGANAVRPAAEALSAAGLSRFAWLLRRGWPSSMVPRRRRRCLRSWCTMPACCGVRLRRRPR
jgi:histidine ammonia-lyase